MAIYLGPLTKHNRKLLLFTFLCFLDGHSINHSPLLGTDDSVGGEGEASARISKSLLQRSLVGYRAAFPQTGPPCP